MQFDDGLTEDTKDSGPASSQVVIAPPTETAPGLDFTAQPAVALHALQERIQRPWADVIPVTTQLCQDPLPNHGLLGGVVQDVHLPESEQHLSVDGLVIDRGHRRAFYRPRWSAHAIIVTSAAEIAEAQPDVRI
jgi:hypothetical protein